MAGPDDETLIECRACGGKWNLAGNICRWCYRGMMTMAQFEYWRARKSGLYAAVKGPTGP